MIDRTKLKCEEESPCVQQPNFRTRPGPFRHSERRSDRRSHESRFRIVLTPTLSFLNWSQYTCCCQLATLVHKNLSFQIFLLLLLLLLLLLRVFVPKIWYSVKYTMVLGYKLVKNDQLFLYG